jgi:hypothetical protein
MAPAEGFSEIVALHSGLLCLLPRTGANVSALGSGTCPLDQYLAPDGPGGWTTFQQCFGPVHPWHATYERGQVTCIWLVSPTFQRELRARGTALPDVQRAD